MEHLHSLPSQVLVVSATYNTTDPSKDDFIGCWIYSNEWRDAGFYDAVLVPFTLAVSGLDDLSRVVTNKASYRCHIPRLHASFVSLYSDDATLLVPDAPGARMFILRKAMTPSQGGNRKQLHLEAIDNGQDPLERIRMLEAAVKQDLRPHKVVINGVEYRPDKPTGDH